jgi:FkbM family methyltransferase
LKIQILLLVAGLSCLANDGRGKAAEPGQPAVPPKEAYEWRQPHDPDGIGKFFCGREIAQVMGHQGADWLERPEREEEEKPSLLIKLLELRTGEAVADIGAGSGYLSWRLAREIGPSGRVYAVDVQPEMLTLLTGNMREHGVTNVIPVLGTITNAHLRASSIDLAILVDVYHEFSYPREMLESICAALKPGAQLVFVEYRAEDPNVPIKRLHKMAEHQVRKEMTSFPLQWVRTLEKLPRQHVIVFEKR